MVDCFLANGLTEHAFINMAAPDADLLAHATYVVDCGGVYDPATGRFDHHQLGNANDTCAAYMVYEFLIFRKIEVEYLKPLVELVYQGDIFGSGAKQSQQLGIHALLSAYKHEKHTDLEILHWGFELLDDLAGLLNRRAVASVELAEKTVYTSADGLLIAVSGGGQTVTRAAEETGVRLVVFLGKPIEDTEGNIVSRPVGINRMGGFEVKSPHCGDLVTDAITLALVRNDKEVVKELESWFRHGSGFFAGRGTGKAMNPSSISGECFLAIAYLLDEVWKR